MEYFRYVSILLARDQDREGIEEKVEEEVEKEEEDDRVWGIERRTTSPGRIWISCRQVERARSGARWTSSSARCKWRIVIRGSARSRQYYALRCCFHDVHGEKRDLLPD